jgi:hypothetical protein
LKTSKSLALVLLTAIFFVSTTISATATIPTNKVTPNGNDKISGFGDAKDAGEVLTQPVRDMTDKYFENYWYASLYDWVKTDIDRNHFGGNRINKYIQTCRTIADNKGLTYSSVIWHPGGEPAQYLYNHLALVVEEENGVINCYQRVPQ